MSKTLRSVVYVGVVLLVWVGVNATRPAENFMPHGIVLPMNPRVVYVNSPGDPDAVSIQALAVNQEPMARIRMESLRQAGIETEAKILAATVGANAIQIQEPVREVDSDIPELSKYSVGAYPFLKESE